MKSIIQLKELPRKVYKGEWGVPFFQRPSDNNMTEEHVLKLTDSVMVNYDIDIIQIGSVRGAILVREDLSNKTQEYSENLDSFYDKHSINEFIIDGNHRINIFTKMTYGGHLGSVNFDNMYIDIDLLMHETEYFNFNFSNERKKTYIKSQELLSLDRLESPRTKINFIEEMLKNLENQELLDISKYNRKEVINSLTELYLAINHYDVVVISQEYKSIKEALYHFNLINTSGVPLKLSDILYSELHEDNGELKGKDYLINNYSRLLKKYMKVSNKYLEKHKNDCLPLFANYLTGRNVTLKNIDNANVRHSPVEYSKHIENFLKDSESAFNFINRNLHIDSWSDLYGKNYVMNLLNTYYMTKESPVENHEKNEKLALHIVQTLLYTGYIHIKTESNSFKTIQNFEEIVENAEYSYATDYLYSKEFDTVNGKKYNFNELLHTVVEINREKVPSKMTKKVHLFNNNSVLSTLHLPSGKTLDNLEQLMTNQDFIKLNFLQGVEIRDFRSESILKTKRLENIVTIPFGIEKVENNFLEQTNVTENRLKDINTNNKKQA